MVISGQIFIQKALQIALAVLVEYRLIAPIARAEELAVSIVNMVEVEIHMESAVVNRALRPAPLRYHCSLGIIFVEHFSYSAPNLCGSDFVVVIFNEGIRHINAETVGALVEPEAHNILYRFDRLLAVGMVWTQLPVRMGDFGKAVIKRGLRAEIIHHIVAVSLTNSAHHPVFGRSVPYVFGEDIAVCIFVLFCLFSL